LLFRRRPDERQNPNYRFFDISTAGPLITRLNSATIKIWAKTSSMRDYELLLVAPLSLASLHFIGKSVRSSLAPNNIVQNAALMWGASR
jgi:hypothetical protein